MGNLDVEMDLQVQRRTSNWVTIGRVDFQKEFEVSSNALGFLKSDELIAFLL